MQSATKPNGSAASATTAIVLARRSKIVSPQLPSFIANRSNDACHHIHAGVARKWCPDQARDQAEARRAAAVAKAEARRGALGNLAVIALAVMAIVMAQYALQVNAEQQLIQERIH
jgi:hypothetical protein